jgi:hypothetical protein
MTSPAAARVTGQAVVYRLFDVGYQIHLDAALDQLASSGPERVRPVRGEAQALQIHNPPVTVVLGSERLVIDGGTFDTEVSARIFDFGVLSLRARIDAPRDLTWDAFTTFGMAVDATARIPEALEHHARLLVNRLGVAVERPGIAPVREDYNVYRIRAITDASGRPLGTDVFRELDLTALLLAESRPLSAEARTELLPHRFSYYADDLAVITWENALVVDPATNDTEMEYVLEFANAQLLELRYYDAVLDAELPKLYDRIERARFGPRTVFRRRYASLLGTMQTLVADSTELVERVENSIKVTDDVYLARVYAAALELFRGRAWRTGIDRKLTIIRDTYAMLNAESQAARAETLELAIIALIVAEIILSFVR